MTRFRHLISRILTCCLVLFPSFLPAAPPTQQTVGNRVGLVILIRFPDRPQDVVFSQADIDAYCNQPGYSASGSAGSVYDYFNLQSNGRLKYTAIVTAYYTAANNKAYYDNSTTSCFTQGRLLLTEALTYLRDVAGFDFSRCDGNGDGWIDAINVFYAGTCSSPWLYGLWPSSSSVNFAPGDGMNSGWQRYQITDMGSSLGLGTYCHENGHMLCGFPDLYDYGYESTGAGAYSLMSSGGSINPRNVDAYLKYKAGWADVFNFSSNDHFRASVTVDRNWFYRYVNPADSKEYFMIETRQKCGYESVASLPDEGILIWHIDEDGSNDNEQRTAALHYEASVEQADNAFHLENDDNSGGADDLFHAGGDDSFTDSTVPDARWWSGVNSGMRISSISALGNTMNFLAGGDVLPVIPSIGVDTGKVSVVCEYGSNAAPVEIMLWNRSGGFLQYDVSANANWLVCSPSNGIVAGDSQLVTASFDTQLLPPGVTNAVITVTSANADNSPQTIAVQLRVNDRPGIRLNPTNLAMTVSAGSTTNQQAFTVRNVGGGLLAYTMTADADWMVLSPAAGTALTEWDTVYATYDATALVNGTYTGTVTVAGAGASNSPQSISVVLTVQGWSGATMDVLGNGMRILRGATTPFLQNHTDFGDVDADSGTVTRTFTVNNAGVSNLVLTGSPLVSVAGVHSNDFAVSAPPSSPVVPGSGTTFQVTFDPGAMGVRSGLVSIANNDGGRNPYTFAIQGRGTKFRYVSPAGSHTAPFDTWDRAATNIQAAIHAASSNYTVLVTNGTYGTGGLAIYGSMTNRVVVTNRIAVKSVNGPSVTFIVGNGPAGNGAVRCAYVASNSVLEGFTLTNGNTRTGGDFTKESSGGGAWCEAGAMIRNCAVCRSVAFGYGGGVYGGTIERCLIYDNDAWYGGGCYNGILNNNAVFGNAADRGGGVYSYNTLIRNCTVVSNTAYVDGGGIYGSCDADHARQNSIIYDNSAPANPNWSSGTYNYSCTIPLPSGMGNITNQPGTLGLRNPHIVSNSACVDAGFNQAASAMGVDIDGEDRIIGGRVDIGCDEFLASGATGVLSAAISVLPGCSAAAGYPLSFAANIQGRAHSFTWTFGDGVETTNMVVAPHSWNATGVYAVVLTAWNGAGPVSCTTEVTIATGTNYVWSGGSHIWPYDSWANAATDIQAAISAACPGGVVLVTNGVYAGGGVAVYGTMTNRIAVTNPVTVKSVNGASATFIEGRGPEGNGAIRCAYVANGAVLDGFTLTNGYTRSSGDTARETSGGGVWCEAAATVRNCVITRNTAFNWGGGTYYGLIQNCAIVSNSAWGGAGTYYGTVRNCVVIRNAAESGGGGAYMSTVQNCTVCSNSAVSSGGGTYSGAAVNSIVYNNVASNYYQTTFEYSCTTPLPAGAGNTNSNPLFVSSDSFDLHLVPDSQCIDSGTNQAWMTSFADLDGNQRIVGPRADMGAYESTNVSVTAYSAWGGVTMDGSSLLPGTGVVCAFNSPHTTAITNSPFSAGPSTQYVCVGWSGTGGIANGFGTNCSFTASGRSSVTWIWTTNVLFSRSAGVGGSTSGTTNGWYGLGGFTQSAATPGPHSSFAGWAGDVAASQSNNNPLALALDRARTITANFALEPRLLTVISARGGAKPVTTTADWGTAMSCSLTNSPIVSGTTQYVGRGGVVLSNSYTEVDATNVTLTLTNDATLRWTWGTNVWLATAVSGSGAVDRASGWYALGTNAAITAAASNGNYFLSWSGDTGGCAIVGNVITAAMTRPRAITARFALDQKTLTVASSYGGAVPGTTTTIWGTAMSCYLTNSPIANGTTQYVGSGGVVLCNDYTVAAPTNITLALTNDATLLWAWGTNCWLAINTSGSGSVNRASGWYALGSDVEITAAASNDHHFLSWGGDTGGCVIAGNVITAAVTRTRVLGAIFVPDYQTLTVVSERGGEDPGTVTTNWGMGMSCYLTNSPVLNGTTQYVAGGGTVLGNGYTVANATNVMLTLTNNATLNWAWQTNYWLSPGVGTGAGSVDVVSNWFASGSSPLLTATAANNYHFVSWGGDTNGCAIVGNTIAVAMAGPRAVTANFALDQKTLTVLSFCGGASPGTTTVDWGTGLDLYLTNSPFVNGTTQYVANGGAVLGNDFTVVDATNITLTLTNNAVLDWTWSTNYWFAVSAGSGGTVAGATSGWYALGGSVTVTGAPDAGYRLMKWSGTDLSDWETNAELTVAMDKSKSVTADFMASNLWRLLVFSEYGNPQPGSGGYADGSNVTCLIDGAPVVNGTTQHVFSGWSRSGSEPGAGGTTNTSFTMTNDAVLVWLWQTNYWLS
ncbi:MAG: hypothetical protein C0404_03495, partial [Verrucomicrobia bacterium]|nr:hypothetical protein [Verrucomicrobiota bacterium]